MPASEETTGCWGFWPPFLKIGKEFLVYAWRFSGTGPVVTTICSRTHLVQHSRDLKALGPGKRPSAIHLAHAIGYADVPPPFLAGLS